MRRALVIGVGFLTACGASRSQFDAGVRSSNARDWDQAVAHYESAAREDPGNLEYRMALLRARDQASHAHRVRARELEAASDLAGAAEAIERALQYEPGNLYLRDELFELRRRLEEPVETPEAVRRERLFSGEPILDPASDVPIDLSFAEETSLRTILETLAKLAGVNILFDEAYRDRTVSVELKGVTFRDALELLLETHGLFYKVIDSTAIQVTPER
ncbi:MAG: hypothetical protein ACRD21_03580 [Vicinamibacteria bacterium]